MGSSDKDPLTERFLHEVGIWVRMQQNALTARHQDIRGGLTKIIKGIDRHHDRLRAYFKKRHREDEDER